MSGKRVELEGWTAQSLVGMTFPEPKWAVPGLLPEGLIVFAGSPKIGKSWFALGVGLAVACGGSALGCIDVDAGDVLYLALEDGPRRLHDRILKVLKGDAVPERLSFEPRWSKLNDGGVELLDEWLDAHPSCRLVVVDTFKYVRATERASADRYQADHDAISPLKEIADKHRVAVLVVHHDRKAEDADFVGMVSGTYGLTAPADAVLVLQRDRGKAEAKLHVTGRDIEERALAVALDAETGSWRLLGEAAEWAMQEQRRRIFDVVREHQGAGPKEVAELLGGNPDTVRRTMGRMAHAAQLLRDNGRYYVPHVRPPLSQVSQVSQGGENPLNRAGLSVRQPDDGLHQLSQGVAA